MFISPCTLGTDSHCSWPFPMMMVVTTNTFDNQVIVLVTNDFGSENCGISMLSQWDWWGVTSSYLNSEAILPYTGIECKYLWSNRWKKNR